MSTPKDTIEWMRDVNKTLADLQRHRHPAPVTVVDTAVVEEVVRTQVALNLETDVPDPVVPSTPTAVSGVSSVAVSWDGYGAGGEEIPAGFARVAIHRSPTGPDFTPEDFTRAASLAGPGTYVFSDQPYDEVTYYRLVMENTVGEVSGPSAAASGAAQRVATTDVGFYASDIDGDGVIAGAVETATAALESANGKNQTTYSAVAPTAADANVVGDTWFQFDGTEVVGQWAGTGGTAGAYGWEPRTLSHQIISSVDAASITVGLLRADQLASELVLASVLKSSEEGRRWEADADGIRVYDADGNAIVNLPTDLSTGGNSFKGDLKATSLEVSDHLSIRGLVNEVSKGSRLVLSSGVTAPTSVPTLTVEWEQFGPTPQPAYDPYRHGLVRYADWYYFAQNLYGSAAVGRLSPLTGAQDDFYNLSNPGLSVVTDAQGGVTNVGGLLYVLGKRADGTWAVEKWNPDTKASAGSWTWAAPSTLSNEPAIGTDGVNLLIGYTLTDGTVRWQVRDTAGALLSTVTTNAGTTRGVMAIGQGTFDFGSTRTFMAFKDATEAAGVYNASGTRQVNEEWPAATGVKARGMVWDATRQEFVAYDTASAKLTVYSGNTWTTESGTWWASYTWANGDVSAETGQSPRKAITMKKRARLRISLPDRPVTDAAVTRTRVFLGRGATEPARTSMFYNGYSTGNSVVVGLPGVVAAWAGASPPSASSFTASSPARIESGAGSFVVNGDGTGVWGGASFGDTATSQVRFAGDVVVDGVLSMAGVRMPRVATGSYVTGVVAAGAGTTPEVIPFPVGRFTSPPSVQVTSGTGRLTPWQASVTTTGFTLGFDNNSGAASSAATATWTATQY